LEVEQWLRALKKEKDLTNPTLDKTRRVMSLVYESGLERYRGESCKSFGVMVARDGVEPPTPAFSGLRTTSLSPWFVNNLTDQSGRFIVPTL